MLLIRTLFSLHMHILGIHQPIERFTLAQDTLIMGKALSQNTFQWPEIFPQLRTVFLHVLCYIMRQNVNQKHKSHGISSPINAFNLLFLLAFFSSRLLWCCGGKEMPNRTRILLFIPVLKQHHTTISLSFRKKTKILTDLIKLLWLLFIRKNFQGRFETCCELQLQSICSDFLWKT